MSHTSSLADPDPGVVCLHANASNSSQWRALANRLAHDYRVFMPDTLGAGQGPAWPSDRDVALRDEVALLEPVFEAAGAPHFLIGHSYGAAIALMAALAGPSRLARWPSTNRRCSRCCATNPMAAKRPAASAPPWTVPRAHSP
jgi:pimeloyl-ACP methyl ester carboxylesterase